MADPHSAPASRRPAFGVGARAAPSSGIGGRTASANPAARQHGSESDPASASARAPASQHPLRTADARTPWHRLRIEQGCEAGGSCSCASAVGGDSSGTPYRPPSDEELAEWGAQLDDQATRGSPSPAASLNARSRSTLPRAGLNLGESNGRPREPRLLECWRHRVSRCV